MSHNIFYDVRNAITKIHQYDVTTTVKGEELDIELKEINDACNNLKAQLPELRKKKYELDSYSEDASMKKQMAKRTINHKVAIVTCLDAEAGRLDLELAKQEEEAQCCLDATEEDPISDMVESFKGLKVEKETELDDVCMGCNKVKVQIEEVKESLKCLQSKGVEVDGMKEELGGKSTKVQSLVSIKEQNKKKIDENLSKKASMSGELQFSGEKFERIQKELHQVDLSVRNMQNAEAQISKEISCRSNEITDDQGKFVQAENMFNQKLAEIQRMEKENLSLADVINELRVQAAGLDPKKIEFEELSNVSIALKEEIEQLQHIEQEKLKLENDMQNIIKEQAEKEEKFAELNERKKYLLSIESQVENYEKELVNLNQNLHKVTEENNELLALLQSMDIKQDEYKITIMNADRSFSNLNIEIEALDKEIEEVEEYIKEIPNVEEAIAIRKMKVNEFENEITLLNKHVSQVTSKVQEEGSIESDHIMKEINNYEHETNLLLAKQNDLELKKLQNEETHGLNIKSIKNERESKINNTVESGIKSIEEKLKQLQDSRRKEMKNKDGKSGSQTKNTGNQKGSILKGIIGAKINKKPSVNAKDDGIKTQSSEKVEIAKPSQTKEKEGKINESVKEAEAMETSDSDSDPFGMAESSESESEKTVNTSKRNPPVHSCIDSKSTSTQDKTGSTNPNTPSRFRRFLNTKSNTSSQAKSTKDKPSSALLTDKSSISESKPPSSGSLKKSLTSPASQDVSQKLNDNALVSNPKTPGSSRVRKTLQTSSNSSKIIPSNHNSTVSVGATKAASNDAKGSVSKINENALSGAKTPGRREKKTLITKRQ